MTHKVNIEVPFEIIERGPVKRDHPYTTFSFTVRFGIPITKAILSRVAYGEGFKEFLRNTIWSEVAKSENSEVVKALLEYSEPFTNRLILGVDHSRPNIYLKKCSKKTDVLVCFCIEKAISLDNLSEHIYHAPIHI